MNSRLLVTALCLAATFNPAFAETPDLATIARVSGTPEIPGLKLVWLAPWGEVSKAHPWRNIIVHQTEGPASSARGGALEQAKNPTRRGVTVWVETDGTVYWAVAENLVPTHGDGANRHDNKYIDNGPTFHQVIGTNSIGVEFAGNYPDVTRGPTDAQIAAWRILVRVLRARYGPLDTGVTHEHMLNRVTVLLTDQHMKVTASDGKVTEPSGRAGDVTMGARVKHIEENLNDHPFEVVAVELKR